MKYTVRLVSWYYDEWDTTCCDVYDVRVRADNPETALEKAKKIVEKESSRHSCRGRTDFAGMTDETGAIFIIAGEKMVFFPKGTKGIIPNSFCSGGGGQTFYHINENDQNAHLNISQICDESIFEEFKKIIREEKQDK